MTKTIGILVYDGSLEEYNSRNPEIQFELAAEERVTGHIKIGIDGVAIQMKCDGLTVISGALLLSTSTKLGKELERQQIDGLVNFSSQYVPFNNGLGYFFQGTPVKKIRN